MNARQKAKKYKKLYESLLNQPVKFNVVTPKVDTLRFDRFYPKEFLDRFDTETLYKNFKINVAQHLEPILDDYIKYDMYYGPDGNRLIGYMKIVPVD
jgi:hypothetical protein